MTTTTNIQMNTGTETQNQRGSFMKRSMFLAPQFSRKTITMFVFAYLAMVSVILVMSANPFQSTASLDFGAQSASASSQTIVVEIPAVQVPAAPYIIVGSAN